MVAVEINKKREKILNFLKMIQDNDFKRSCSNTMSWSVYDNDDVIILLSGGNKNEQVVCKNKLVNKEFLWVTGKLKFIFHNGEELFLSEDTPTIKISPGQNYIVKSCIDNSLCIIILRV